MFQTTESSMWLNELRPLMSSWKEESNFLKSKKFCVILVVLWKQEHNDEEKKKALETLITGQHIKIIRHLL